MAVMIAQRPFTVDEYYTLSDVGILTEDDRVELIEGKIVELSPIGSRHAAIVNKVAATLHQQLGQAAIISVQNPVRLDDYSEPQPDVALVQARDDFYAGGHPGVEDVLLLVEVADSSEEYDRRVKVPLYARAGIPEAWVVNLNRNVVEVFSNPVGGDYVEQREARPGEVVGASLVPLLVVEVSGILGL
jgi:Uma2 family endonuclease